MPDDAEPWGGVSETASSTMVTQRSTPRRARRRSSDEHRRLQIGAMMSGRKPFMMLEQPAEPLATTDVADESVAVSMAADFSVVGGRTSNSFSRP